MNLLFGTDVSSLREQARNAQLNLDVALIELSQRAHVDSRYLLEKLRVVKEEADILVSRIEYAEKRDAEVPNV